MRARVAALAALILIAPTAASADFVWLPLLYVYTYRVWWVVAGGLAIEALVYKWGFRRSWRSTAILTVGVNIASALAGGAFSWGSLLLLRIPGKAGDSVTLDFVVASPFLLLGVTTLIEYLAATRVFGVAREWKSLGVIAAANLPSVGLAVYAAVRLALSAV